MRRVKYERVKGNGKAQILANKKFLHPYKNKKGKAMVKPLSQNAQVIEGKMSRGAGRIIIVRMGRHQWSGIIQVDGGTLFHKSMKSLVKLKKKLNSVFYYYSIGVNRREDQEVDD